MSVIQVSSTIFPNYRGGGTFATLRIFADQSFVSSTQVEILASNPGQNLWYQEVECTVDGTDLQTSLFTIDSNTDSDVPNGTYTGIIYGEDGEPLYVLFNAYVIPHQLGSSINWVQLVEWNSTSLPFVQNTTYSKYQIDVLFNDLSLAPLSTDAVAGKLKSSAFMADPVAVTTADRNRTVNSLSNYDNSLDDAKTAIGSDEVFLVATEQVTVEVNTDMPANITLDAQFEGSFFIAAGAILTIRSMAQITSRQIFYLEDDTASVRFGKGAVECLNAAWWTGNTLNADASLAVENMIASASFAGGGQIFYFPTSYQIAGQYTLPSGVTLLGTGNAPSSGVAGIVLKLTAASTADYMFKIGETTYAVRGEGLLLDANGVVADAILFEGTGGDNTSSGDFSFSKVTFNGFRNHINIHSLGGSWQLAQLKLDQCSFIGQTNAGIKANSVNGQLTMIGTNFAPATGAKCYDFESVGLVTIIGGEYAGGDGTTAVMNISGSHGAINLIGVQDENFGSYITNEASDASGIINIFGSLVQSNIILNESCLVNLFGSILVSHGITGDASGAVVTARGCYVREVDSNNDPVVPAKLSDFTGGGSIITIEENGTRQRFRLPLEVYSPLVSDGAPDTPVIAAGYRTNTSETKRLIQWGELDANEVFTFSYWIERDHSTGLTYFKGDQDIAFRGYVFDAFIRTLNAAYSADWDGATSVPTRNDIFDAFGLVTAAGKSMLTAANAAAQRTLLSLVIGTNVQAWSANLDEYSAVNPTSAGLAILDDVDNVAQLVTLGLTATASEVNLLNDVSVYTETLIAAGAISTTKVYSKLELVGSGAVTLAVPSATMLGQVKTIEQTIDNGDVSLSLANCEGQSSGTTATFTAVGQKLILVAGSSKWTIIKELGVTMS